MSIHDYESWELKPRGLSAEEREVPQDVIREFFSFAHLPQVRSFLWDWLKTTIAGNFNTALSKRERADLLSFYEQLVKLIEAAYLLRS